MLGTTLRTSGAGVLLLAALLSGCSLQPMARGEVPGPHQGRTFTAADIERSGARTAWEALELFGAHLRTGASGLAHRGRSSIVLETRPLVFIDGVRLVEHGVLRGMPARQLSQMRLLSGPDATTYYGTDAGHGVLLIETRKR